MLIKSLFFVFAAIAIISALSVITSRNPVRAVLSLVVAFVATAGIWMLLEAEFLSLVLIVVYVGAVMVLFMFVVMMLDIDVATAKASFVRYWPLALLAGVLVVALLIINFNPELFGFKAFAAPKAFPADYSNTRVLGHVLYTHYLYPFEVAGMILLTAMIAAITLTFRGKRADNKAVAPKAQIAVNAQSRLTLVDMPSESKPTSDSNPDQGTKS